ncbi:hypothetical protein BKN38_09950 [Helicobacter sp. CLO-3]|uniref:hypothetical protein n=1 Tax=unclassified Helicobacter TaxID=2593540 RepID=UPI000804840B|nr:MULTISPECIES: hypothetical protein [unclassified Helicobacter]OBV30166.1 hypothetical protein BA723_09760 [Helicobacter sp. CLO-3]OHU80997.1 hypothetical protein BKN38_09950 [Helicobacter sp. CLO-3]
MAQNTQIKEFERFYQALDKLKVQGDSIEQKRKEITRKVTNFAEDVWNLKINPKILHQNKEIAEILQEALAKAKYKVKTWEDIFKQKAKQEKFRSELENSFIIIVYGKVKAGKSSLANFVISHRLPNQECKIYEYDKAGEGEAAQLKETDKKEFETGILECTAEIQLFKLGGMAWVDTPGLSSLTKANGDLAREYIEAADFVIFPNSSEEPGQDSGMSQMGELLKLGKNISIILTKSDEPQRINKDGKITINIINKTNDRREGQEKHVMSRAIEICKNTNAKKEQIDKNILSISMLCATNGLKNGDETLFKESNIQRFYDNMYDLLTNKANELKQKAPYENLKALIESINSDADSSDSASLQAMRADFARANEAIEKVRQEIASKKPAIKIEIESKVREMIEKCKNPSILASIFPSGIIMELIERFVKKEQPKEATKSQNEFERLSDILLACTAEIIDKSLQEILKNFTSEFNSAMSAEGFEIESRTKSVKRNKSRLEQIGDSMFGGGFIEYVLEWWTTSPEYEDVPDGDNREEVFKEFTQKSIKHYGENMLDSTLKQVEESFFNPLESELLVISSKIDSLSQELKEIQTNLK